jgi:hypothetical protein
MLQQWKGDPMALDSHSAVAFTFALYQQPRVHMMLAILLATIELDDRYLIWGAFLQLLPV